VAVGQILTILLDNAARASRDRVTLRASPALRAGYVDFEVCDAGPGIPASLRNTLGTVPVESTQGGHGVGLYLAFSSAARLGGTIELTDVAAGPGSAASDGGAASAGAVTVASGAAARPGKPRGTRAVLRVPVKVGKGAAADAARAVDTAAADIDSGVGRPGSAPPNNTEKQA
jgi:two-component system, sensor histidine kinase RegB